MTVEVPPGTDLGVVMSQDIGIMLTAQRGLHQPGLKHLTLSAEECRVINLHRNLDQWLGVSGGRGPLRPPTANDGQGVIG